MKDREPEKPTPREHAEQDDFDEQELKRRYYERLSDWSEPDVVKVYRNGRLVEPLVEPDRVELRKRIFMLPWAGPKR